MPTQYKKTKDAAGLELPPGTIRIRIAGKSPGEHYAFPADPNRMPIPLYGEQVLCFSQPDGKATKSGESKWYYSQVVNTHGNVNNAVLPFLQDKGTEEGDYGANAIVKTSAGGLPSQLSFAEQDITFIQPFQGDTNLPDRFGSILRFSSTHLKSELIPYLKKPFWEGAKKGDPFVSLTCGVKDARSGKSVDKYYAIENPEEDSSFIYLTSSQKIPKFKFAQDNVGVDVLKLSKYDKPQVIIGSDRLIFNARKDELVLVSKKDVKIATPAWQADMDELFTQLEAWLLIHIKMAEGISMPYATPSGPTGPSAALPDLKKVHEAIKKMKQ